MLTNVYCNVFMTYLSKLLGLKFHMSVSVVHFKCHFSASCVTCPHYVSLVHMCRLSTYIYIYIYVYIYMCHFSSLQFTRPHYVSLVHIICYLSSLRVTCPYYGSLVHIMGHLSTSCVTCPHCMCHLSTLYMSLVHIIYVTCPH